jgi:lipoprotein-anchoring transpeptidase ErfK/SrfK
MIRPQHNTIRRTVKLRRLILLFGAASAVILCSSCEEIPPYAEQPRIAAGYPPETPPGWWDDAGVSGSPKIVVHIGDQKAYFYKGKHLVGETTVSTGKPGFSTPPGRYQVLSKSPDHVSTIFGDYVDDYGNVVRSNIDARKDRRPPGTHFDGAEMPYAMFFRGGYAMHQGYVPPFAASHGCIRLPRGMAEPFFENAPVGTPVTVKE